MKVCTALTDRVATMFLRLWIRATKIRDYILIIFNLVTVPLFAGQGIIVILFSLSKFIYSYKCTLTLEGKSLCESL
jgi:hypothetical protein